MSSSGEVPRAPIGLMTPRSHRATILLSLWAALTPGALQAQVQTMTDTLFDRYEPTESHPFGRPHPDLPAGGRRFEFLVGRFECTDELLQADGSWRTSRARWTTRWILNGQAIQDSYWNDQFAGTSLRQYDPTNDSWIVTFLGMPGPVVGVWEGRWEGDRMVMRQARRDAAGHPVTSRLTFYDIRPDGYEWVGEVVRDGVASPNWRIRCDRVD